MAAPARLFQTEKLYSSEDFEKLPEFNESYELVEGRLVKKSVPGFEHANIANYIKEQYTLFDPERNLGVMMLDVSTKIGEKDTPLPDLSYWTAANRPQHIKGAASLPDLVVEVLSPHDLETRKRREEAKAKIRRYQAAGVKICWLINPTGRWVEIYHPGRLDAVQVLGLNDELDGGELIPGFKIELKKLFEI